jgi:hypothetical protein
MLDCLLPDFACDSKQKARTARRGRRAKFVSEETETDMPIVSRDAAFVVREWRPHSKNTLVGFLVLELPSGLVIRDVMLHQKGDARWLSMPAREYQRDGERSWVPLIEFTTKATREAFQSAALVAVDSYLREGTNDTAEGRCPERNG